MSAEGTELVGAIAARERNASDLNCTVTMLRYQYCAGRNGLRPAIWCFWGPAQFGRCRGPFTFARTAAPKKSAPNLVGLGHGGAALSWVQRQPLHLLCGTRGAATTP
jgi:hypothetical protein